MGTLVNESTTSVKWEVILVQITDNCTTWDWVWGPMVEKNIQLPNHHTRKVAWRRNDVRSYKQTKEWINERTNTQTNKNKRPKYRISFCKCPPLPFYTLNLHKSDIKRQSKPGIVIAFFLLLCPWGHFNEDTHTQTKIRDKNTQYSCNINKDSGTCVSSEP